MASPGTSSPGTSSPETHDACCGLPAGRAEAPSVCPSNGRLGRSVQTITLKALLRPAGLSVLDPRAEHRYCPDPACDTVYYDAHGREYPRQQVEVPVYAKEPPADDVPVCYCFGWTRGRLRTAGQRAAAEIRAHVRAGRCGCEVNNPKGACCLGDVEQVLSATAATDTPAAAR